MSVDVIGDVGETPKTLGVEACPCCGALLAILRDDQAARDDLPF